MKVLLIDFYDSFTYNLAHYFENSDCEVKVVRHDELDLTTLSDFDKIVLSPGPGLPTEKMNMMEVIQFCDSKQAILGICLGMQALSIYVGATLENQQIVKHGVQEKIHLKKNSLLFKGLPQDIKVGLYHSWHAVNCDENHVTARSENNVIMAIEIPERKIFGVQFHPESIMTEFGLDILRNFIRNT